LFWTTVCCCFFKQKSSDFFLRQDSSLRTVLSYYTTSLGYTIHILIRWLCYAVGLWNNDLDFNKYITKPSNCIEFVTQDLGLTVLHGLMHTNAHSIYNHIVLLTSSSCLQQSYHREIGVWLCIVPNRVQVQVQVQSLALAYGELQGLIGTKRCRDTGEFLASKSNSCDS